MTRTPLIKYVPKDPRENLRWRLRVRERALEDLHFRHAMIDAVCEDVLFWMNGFCWCVEPRAEVKVKPFITWPHQDPVFVAMDQAIDDSQRDGCAIDVLVEKSRAQGGTYGYLWVDLRRWLRDPMFTAGYVTRNEDLVDSATDSSTLFWKLAWAIEMLPFWLRPNGFSMKQHRSISGHTIVNPENGAVLSGYAAGQDVGRGGRATVFTCISGGTLVVTDRGLVPIEEVTLSDRVWDGKTWVSHDGCVYQGERETILAYGIRLTPDHRVFTKEGWCHASKGFDRSDIRLPDGYRARHVSNEGQHAVDLCVPLREQSVGVPYQLDERDDEELRLLEEGGHRKSCEKSRSVQDSDIPDMGQDDPALHKSEYCGIHSLRWTWHCGLRSLVDVREFSGGHGRATGEVDSGAYRQLRGLRTVELSVGNETGSIEQHAEKSLDRDFAGCFDDGGSFEDRRNCLFKPEAAHQEGPRWGRASVPCTTQTEAVYDLLNCGPRRAFTVIDDRGCPLLVHNCDEIGAKDFIKGGKDFSVMESLHEVSNCIRMVSTFGADSGVFYDACNDPDGSGVHLILDWKDNPEHGRHAYMVNKGYVAAIRPEDQGAVNEYHKNHPDVLKKLERKGHQVEGKIRSPWYDSRCLRKGATPRLIARELDRDPRGAVGKVFESDLLDKMKRLCCKPPVWQGVAVFDDETLELKGLLTQKDGPLKLWFKPGADYSPPLGPFTVGCDIAIGSSGPYASNSVASGIDDRTGEQVLEYAVKGVPSIKFARAVVGLCKWLRNAYLGWEDSGMAGPFAKEIVEVICYGKVYYRPVNEIGSHRKTRKAGWWNGSDDDKGDLFEKLALAFEGGRYIPRSEDLIRECGEYEWENGKIIHRPTKNHGATEKAHGDRCIATGVAYLLYSETTESESTEYTVRPQKAAYGSFAWREERERATIADSDSPDFCISNLLLN